MSTVNPYQSPLTESGPPIAAPVRTAANYVGGTIVPRYLAASGDALVAIVLALLAGAWAPETMPVAQLVAMIAVWIGYFFFPEWLVSTSPGKLLAGLVVVQMDGTRITWRQAALRTVFRLLEVNPILLGALPAGLCIVFSTHRQRFGDHVAGTVVVRARCMRK